jgi:RimJ/RimL family protein N-acetyltransferase
MKLETKRLILREFKDKDANDLQENINNIKVVKWLLVVPYPYTIKDAKEYIKKTKGNIKQKPQKDYSFAIELKETKKVIGGIGLHELNKFQGKADIGYWLGEKYWRDGYGSEALEAIIKFSFYKLKLRRLEAGVFAKNPSSGKLLEKYGFVKEGLKRKACVSKADKKINDEFIYGLLKEEYKKS